MIRSAAVLAFLFFAAPALAQTDVTLDPSVGYVTDIASSGNVVLIGTSAGGVWRSLDGGVTVAPTSFDKGHVWAVLFTPTALYAGAEGGLWRSDDGGATWANVALTRTHVYDLDYDPVTDITYAATWGGALFRKGPAATTWTAINDGIPPNGVGGLEIMTHPSADVVIASIYGFGVYWSDDDGADWDAAAADVVTPYVYALGSTVATTFAGTWGDGVWRSDDFGRTWTRSGLDGLHVYDLATNAAGFAAGTIYAATNDGLYVSTDDGLSWTLFAHEGEAVFAVALSDDDVLRTGMEAAMSTVGGVPTALEDVPTLVDACYAFPNPAASSGTLTMAFTLSVPAETHGGLYDVLGRRVATVPQRSLTAGPHRVAVELNSLASGVYVYRLHVGAETLARRIVVR